MVITLLVGVPLLGGLALSAPAAKREAAPAAKRELAPLATSKTALVPFESSPFPYRGDVPGKNRPFLDVLDGERRGHASPRGGTYWEDETYSDRRVLLHIPPQFDVNQPGVIIVFFHGNGATLGRDVRDRQQVPRQVAESGLNAVLVAPQFAVNALDSSAGRFWQPDGFPQFLQEAGERLTELYGDERARGAFAAAPLVIAAYSGGYYPAAFIVEAGRVDERLRGLILFDALFGDFDRFAAWLGRHPAAFFVSAYGKSARDENATFQRMLAERGIAYRKSLPGTLSRGVVAFIAAEDDVEHADFMTASFVRDPLKVVLRRIAGFARAGR